MRLACAVALEECYGCTQQHGVLNLSKQHNVGGLAELWLILMAYREHR